MFEKISLVIALDQSTSMGGRKWVNALNGAKQLIEYIKENHVNPHDVHLIILFFNH